METRDAPRKGLTNREVPSEEDKVAISEEAGDASALIGCVD